MNSLVVNLGDVTKIKTGKLDANASSEDGEYPFFTCAQKPLRISSYSYDCECVLIAGNGDLNVKYYEGKFDAYQRTYIVEVLPEKRNRLHLRYAYHFLETYLDTLREQSIGGIIKYIKMGNLTDAQIPLPPLAEQKRVAAILDAADALRAKRREALAQLDALLQSSFLTLFGDPVSNPMGWEKPSLLELCSARQWPTISGSQLEPSGYPVYGANGQIGYYSKYNHEHPTVLVTCRGATCGTINICPPKCYVTGNAMALDDPDPKRITLGYLEWVLRIRGMNDVICGAAQPQITRTGMAPIRIPLPPLPLQQKVAAIVESIERQKTTQRAHLAELDALFAALQHRAFRGEL